MNLADQKPEVWLTAACCLLGGIWGNEVFAPLPAFDLPAVTLPERPQPAAIAPFNAPPQAAFSAIDAKPIFNPARTPVESSATSAAATTPPDVALVGVIIDGKNQMALVKREGAPFAESVSLGASIDGWEVVEIGPDQVLLRSGGQEISLRLDAKRKSLPGQTGVMSNPDSLAPFPRNFDAPKTSITRARPSVNAGGNDRQQGNTEGVP